MFKIIKWLGIGIATIAVVGVLLVWINSEKKPVGETGAAADALANKMLSAINIAAWDTTKLVQWEFAGMHDFLWDKERNFVQVEWGKYKVLLDTKKVSGKAWKNGIALEGKKRDKAIQKAWAFFCNGSFWLNAPAKAFDEGTSRSIVTLKDGREGLMVSYAGGGVTPGDAYVWLLNEAGLPIAWKMWVKVIPIGGLEASWENWNALSTQAQLAGNHKIGPVTIELKDIRSGQTLAELGLTEDPFEEIVP